MMKQVLVLCSLVVVLAYCTRTVDETIEQSLPANITGKWTLTQVQSPGYGPAGTWSAASPSGQTMAISQNGKITGSAFPTASAVKKMGDLGLKVVDPGVQPGYRLFNYQIDTVANILFLYIQPADGAMCNEGCGGFRFERND
jgi:hypothetical protein